jgi:hypothetical protein
MKQMYFISIIFVIFSSLALQAQEKNDTIAKGNKKEKQVPLTPYHRNVIKFNPTPMILWGDRRNITFTYERLIKKDMSVSLQAGFLLFPNLLDDTIRNLIAITGKTRKGINLALDYRYYPFSRNRRPAPDGMYIGGYLSYYGFLYKTKFDVLHTTVDQQGELDGKVSLVNLGLSVGYQFIFWKRFTLDLLMFGPSFSMLSGSIKISGQLDSEEIQNIDQELVDKLLNRFPYLESIFSSDGLQYTGRKTQYTPFLRYSIQFGFHF